MCAHRRRRCRTWAHNLCEEWHRPDGQAVHTRAESRRSFGLIPVGVSGEGVLVGGGVEQKEEKIGMFRRDMACGWKCF